MCLSKKRIINPTKRIDDYCTPVYLDVPCNSCKSCDDRKQRDWFVRAVAEYKRCCRVVNGSHVGFVWFPTLTYAPETLPVWHDTKYNYSVPCFEKKHFVSFRNKLRVYLSRAGYDLTGDNTMRYMYVTEYGGKKGRPHIHCLLFVPVQIPFKLFKALVKKAWIYGQVRYSPTGDYIKSVKALSYTMKYLAKDMAWLHEYHVNEYLAKLKSDVLDAKDPVEKHVAEFHYKEFRKRMPHHCQSMGFGSSFCPSDEQFINNNIPASELSLYDSTWLYQVPMYYRRKFLYDFDKVTGLYTINSRGKSIAQRRFPLLVRALERYIDSRLDVVYFDDMSKWLPDINLLPDYDYFTKLASYPSDMIAKYIIAFRNVQIPNISFLKMSHDDIEQYVNDNAVFYYLQRLDNGDIVPLDGYKRKLDVPLWNMCPELCDIEAGLQFIENADKMIAQYKRDAYLDDLYKSQIQFKFV